LLAVFKKILTLGYCFSCLDVSFLCLNIQIKLGMKKINFFFALFISAFAANANNITVSNASLSGQNTGTQTITINYDVAWENSWRTSTNESNWDGAWVFIKYKKNGTLEWRHCTLNTAGFSSAAGSVSGVSPDGKGLLIHRAANGIGNVSYAGNTVIWNYGVDGVLNSDQVEIRVFAVEMVFIPQGSFFLGSGGSESFYFRTGATTNPFLVDGSTINLTNAGTSGLNNFNLTTGTVPAVFPTGFDAFWIMKYEASQQQYIDFLNHLDLAKANVFDIPSIRTGTHPNLIPNNPERGVGGATFLASTIIYTAIADWSGLRPYTEMEFEKICRGGNIAPLANEYVWGSTTSNSLATVSNAGLSNETVATPANANINLGAIGATRVGLFARPTGSTRELSGGAYYGVQDMGGNLYEIVISGSYVPSLAFSKNVHGDGYLLSSGYTDIAVWNANGNFGLRGSGISGPVSSARTSDRANANFFAASGLVGSTAYGYRMARTAF
jgi:formylglycine-generating enzyme required for sulfatase activity